jgi:hypothetical protein
MSRVIRRIGPWALWLYAICAIGLPLYFAIAQLILENTWPSQLLASGLILAPLAAVIIFRNPLSALIDNVALVEPDGSTPRRWRGLRLERHANVFLLGSLATISLALHVSRSIVESSGLAIGLLAYMLAWHGTLLLPLTLWAKHRDAERPLPPKRGTTAPGIAELWIVPPDEEGEEGEDGPIAMAVRTEGIRSLEEVVVAVLGRPVLPAIEGGERRWSIVVDDAPVGELIQSWQHPRWWPPIEWSVSPSSPFKGGRVTFRPLDGSR